jgi:hypothetical protein
MGMNGGRSVKRFFAMVDGFLKENPDAPYAGAVKLALERLQKATLWLMQNGMSDREQAGAAATPYLRLFALTTVAFFWSRMAMVARQQLDNGSTETDFYQAKLAAGQFFVDRILPQSLALMAEIESGKDNLMAMTAEQF